MQFFFVIHILSNFGDLPCVFERIIIADPEALLADCVVASDTEGGNGLLGDMLWDVLGDVGRACSLLLNNGNFLYTHRTMY